MQLSDVDEDRDEADAERSVGLVGAQSERAVSRIVSAVCR